MYWSLSELVARTVDLTNSLDFQADPLRVAEIRREWGYDP